MSEAIEAYAIYFFIALIHSTNVVELLVFVAIGWGILFALQMHAS